ncbi:hypothetical protein [Butyrivibrio sp. INlla16]|uniref:hypothetical protein n=1 Tax=Butyrivibrio sp. INlla16 TaxID=1520807 RepID=UPI00088996FB|nr:hypothetical protein [Butyrivibrio sp. INlla16]SDB50082.1 hypothetical protein SAMN02910263_02499 [Butyrivibrio sp. INlla16]
MGQAIGETIFEVLYLIFAVVTGIQLIYGGKESRLPGYAALILGCGDAFHLVPRMYALWTDGTANHPVSLGIGTLITSITMTVFYVLLYLYLKKVPCRETGKALDICVYILAALRIILCLFPQNRWTSPDAPLSWGIIRNVPFVILGIVVIVYAFKWCRKDALKLLWLAIILSFTFYIPVVLFADSIPAIGALMLPKTVMYIWIIIMLRKECRKKVTDGVIHR